MSTILKTYLEHLNPEYLRYYCAAKLNGSVDDLDLNLEDFAARVNLTWSARWSTSPAALRVS